MAFVGKLTRTADAPWGVEDRKQRGSYTDPSPLRELTIHAQVRKVRAVTPDHQLPRGPGPALRLDTLSGRDRARAVLDEGEYRGSWRVIGRHDDHYIVQMPDGKLKAMTERDVLDWPLQWFLNIQTNSA